MYDYYYDLKAESVGTIKKYIFYFTRAKYVIYCEKRLKDNVKRVLLELL